MTGPMEEGTITHHLPVDRDVYEEALGRSIPIEQDRVTVDDTGYSRTVGNVLGPDYLDNTLIIFNKSQLQRTTYDTYRVDEIVLEMVDRYEAVEGFLDDYGPIGVTYDIRMLTEFASMDEFLVQARYDPDHSSDAFSREWELQYDLGTLNQDDLRDADRIASLLDRAESSEEELAREVWWPVWERMADTLLIPGHDSSTFLFHTDAPYAIVFGSEENPFSDRTDGYWKEQTGTDLVEHLQEQELVEIDETEALRVMDQMAGHSLDSIEQEYARDNTRYGNLQRLLTVFSLDPEDHVTPEFHALAEMMAENDVSLETRADEAKLRAITSQDPFYRNLLHTLAATKDRDHIWRHGRYEADIDDLKMAYFDWRERRKHGVDRIPEGYGAETVQEFCDEVPLRGRDGIFLSALINEMVEDEIVLGDMSGVRFIGSRLSDKHVTIDGNAGEWLGAYLEGGVIEVLGDATRMVGTNSTGGEIYLHGGGRPYYDDSQVGATVYRKKKLRSLVSRDDRWKRVR